MYDAIRPRGGPPASWRGPIGRGAPIGRVRDGMLMDGILGPPRSKTQHFFLRQSAESPCPSSVRATSGPSKHPRKGRPMKKIETAVDAIYVPAVLARLRSLGIRRITALQVEELGDQGSTARQQLTYRG